MATTTQAEPIKGPRILWRYTALLFCMIALVAVAPFVTDDELPRIFIDLIFTGAILTAAFSVAGQRHFKNVALGLALVSVVMKWVVSRPESMPVLDAVGHGTSLVFMLLMVIYITVDLFRTQEVTADTIVGGICAYLLIGVLFAEAYSLIELIQPGSFTRPGPFEVNTSWKLEGYSYFSFVTLTTLGYGDMTPLKPAARSVAVLEALIGQLYVVILISRLVGIRMQTQLQK